MWSILVSLVPGLFVMQIQGKAKEAWGKGVDSVFGSVLRFNFVMGESE